jgi:hypothetical protein
MTTRDAMAVLDRVCSDAVEDGRRAARGADRGVAALRGVVAATVSTPEARAYLFGFLDGVSEVWEGTCLLDFVEGDDDSYSDTVLDIARDAVAYIDTFKHTRPDRGRVASEFGERLRAATADHGA